METNENNKLHLYEAKRCGLLPLDWGSRLATGELFVSTPLAPGLVAEWQVVELVA